MDRNCGNDELGVKVFQIQWAGPFSMARPDRSMKMPYGLVGLIVGAILTRIVVLLKQRAADRREMDARLNQLAL